MPTYQNDTRSTHLVDNLDGVLVPVGPDESVTTFKALGTGWTLLSSDGVVGGSVNGDNGRSISVLMGNDETVDLSSYQDFIGGCYLDSVETRPGTGGAAPAGDFGLTITRNGTTIFLADGADGLNLRSSTAKQEAGGHSTLGVVPVVDGPISITTGDQLGASGQVTITLRLTRV